MLTDYLAAEQPIIERLREHVPGLREVKSIMDVGAATAHSQVTPAAHVVYDGDRLQDTAGRGQSAMTSQRWIVIVLARSARGAASGAGARDLAGPLMIDVISALSGFTPTSFHRPLERVNAPRPSYHPGGLGLFPLAFETRLLSGAES